jgi:hypothetical protein
MRISESIAVGGQVSLTKPDNVVSAMISSLFDKI